MARVLTIGGHDWSGRRGIEADLRVFQAYGIWAFSALAGTGTLTEDITRSLKEGVDAVKIGRLESADETFATAECLKAVPAPVVLHPRVPDAGKRGADALNASLRQYILPLTTVLVLNTVSAERLVGFPVRDSVDMRRAARTLGHLGATAVLVTGGSRDQEESARDCLWEQGRERWLEAPWSRRRAATGKGAALSAAATAGLALGLSSAQALDRAKKAVLEVLGNGPDIGWEASVIHFSQPQ